MSISSLSTAILVLVLLLLPSAPIPHQANAAAAAATTTTAVLLGNASTPEEFGLVPLTVDAAEVADSCSPVIDEEEDPVEMEATAARRMLVLLQRQQQQQQPLVSRRFISYASLRADVVPCSRPGVPYYNCLEPPRANAYHRGCGTITRCARFDFP